MRYLFTLLGFVVLCNSSLAQEAVHYTPYKCAARSDGALGSDYDRWKQSSPSRAIVAEMQNAAQSKMQSGQCQHASAIYSLLVAVTDQKPEFGNELRFEATLKLFLALSAQEKYREMEPFLATWLLSPQHLTSPLNSELGMAYFGVAEYYFLKAQFEQAEKYALLAIKNVEADERFFIGMDLHAQHRKIYDLLAAIYYREGRFSLGETARTKKLNDPKKNYITSVRPENAEEKRGRLRAEIIQRFSKGKEVEATEQFLSNFEEASNAETVAKRFLDETQEKLGLFLKQQAELNSMNPQAGDGKEIKSSVDKRISLAYEIPRLKQVIRESERKVKLNACSVGESAFDLAEAYHQQQSYEDAERMYKIANAKWQVLRLVKKEAESNSSLGMLYRAMGNYQDAEAYLRSASVALRSFYGTRHPDVLEVETELAYVFQQRKNYLEAKELYLKNLANWEESSSPDLEEIAQILEGVNNFV